MSPQIVVRIQTAVVAAVTLVITAVGHWLATKNVSVDLTPLITVFTALVMGVVALAYRIGVAWLQKHVSPALGWLKGHPGIVTQVINPTATQLPPGPHQ